MSTILTQSVARLILLPTLITALAILIKGYASVGDGFSAGVVAGAGVAIQFLAFGPRELVARYPQLRSAPFLAFGGLLVALCVAFAPVLMGDPIMTQYPRPGEPVKHIGLLAFHTAVLFDVAVFLVVFGFVVSALGLIVGIRQEGEDPNS